MSEHVVPDVSTTRGSCSRPCEAAGCDGQLMDVLNTCSLPILGAKWYFNNTN